MIKELNVTTCTSFETRTVTFHLSTKSKANPLDRIEPKGLRPWLKNAQLAKETVVAQVDQDTADVQNQRIPANAREVIK